MMKAVEGVETWTCSCCSFSSLLLPPTVVPLFPPLLPARSLALLCGPEIMMRFAALKLEQLGLARHDVWVSLERNMKCALGSCGHCQLGPRFLCKEGPVFHWADVEAPLRVREL